MEEGDGKFWLPPDFLDDDDGLFLDVALDFPGSNPESDEEEDDLSPGITTRRRMTATFLHDDDGGENRKERTMSGSPQSILCDLAVWSNCSKESPGGPSCTESTPPSTPLEQSKDDDALDLLAAAAGQVSRLQGASPVPAGSSYIRFYSNLAVPQHMPIQDKRWNRQEYPSAWGRQPGRGYNGVVRASDCPPLQRQPHPPLPGSGMRAVFLTGKGRRRESTGTGVFLPRRPGNPTEMRRKPAACSVLLPDRVIQALNLNLDEMSAIHGLPRIASPVAKQMRERHRPSPSAAFPCHEQLQLPAEWTY